MGNSHALVVNKTHRKICIITFNQADLIYQSYHSMYILEPAETKQVEANSDPIGLKIGIIYDAVPGEHKLLYQRWSLKNESTLTITAMEGEIVSCLGGMLHSHNLLYIFLRITNCITYNN